MKPILMIVEAHYPNDIRVRKEAESLAKNGYDITIVALAKSNDRENETINNVKVIRIKNYNSFIKGMMDLFNSLFQINPIFYFKLKPILRNFSGTLVVHDLPLSLTILALKSPNQKVILDMHENYPEAITIWFLWRKSVLIKIKNALFFGYHRWLAFEQKALEKIDGLIVVVEEMKESVKKKHPNFSKPIAVISNYENKSFCSDLPSDGIETKYVPKGAFAITYMGGITPERGIDTAILGMKKVVQSIPNAKLLIFGSGHPDNVEYLKLLAKKNTISDNVLFYGHIPFAEINKVMISSHINIIPHVSHEHTDNTIPHKLFQILLAKKPILVSTCKPLFRIVKETNSGYVFESSNSDSFAQKIVEIYNDYDLATSKAKNGFEYAFNGKFNWENQEQIMIDFYNNFLWI